MAKQRDIIVTSILLETKKRIEERLNNKNKCTLTVLGKVEVFQVINGVSVKQTIELGKLQWGERVCLERVVRGKDGIDFLTSETFDLWDAPKDWKIDVNEDDDSFEMDNNLELTEEESQEFLNKQPKTKDFKYLLNA